MRSVYNIINSIIGRQGGTGEERVPLPLAVPREGVSIQDFNALRARFDTLEASLAQRQQSNSSVPLMLPHSAGEEATKRATSPVRLRPPKRASVAMHHRPSVPKPVAPVPGAASRQPHIEGISPSHMRNIIAFVDRLASSNDYAAEFVAYALAEINRVNLVIWAGGPDLLPQAPPPHKSVQQGVHTAHLRFANEHFTCLIPAEGGQPLPSGRPGDKLLSRDVREVDAGGGGDCLFLAFAWSLDLMGYRSAKEAHRSSVGHQTDALAPQQANRAAEPTKIWHASLTARKISLTGDSIDFQTASKKMAGYMRGQVAALWGRKLSSNTAADSAERASLAMTLWAAASADAMDRWENCRHWSVSDTSTNLPVLTHRRDLLETVVDMMPDDCPDRKSAMQLLNTFVEALAQPVRG